MVNLQSFYHLQEVIKRDDFLYENNLQGIINGSSLGLYYNNKLVSILVYGKSLYNKKYDLEIYRFCNKKNTNVIGALSKLTKQLKGYIISYCDRRYSTGSGYIESNFKMINKSKPSYYYIKQDERISQMNFQKYKLKKQFNNFDYTISESQNMRANEYYKIWDCGNLVFSYDN